MFPFLAPIRQPNFRYRVEPTPERRIEIIFLSESPRVSRRPSEVAELGVERIQTHLGIGSTSSSSGSRGSSVSPRPKSSSSSTNRSNLSQPTSARSAKSSPVPPPLSQPPPPPNRHKNKGLETSSAMMELFGGGGGSTYGASSAFEIIPPMPEQSRSFGRKNVLERENQEESRWEQVRAPQPPNSGPFFSAIEDHEKAYERATKRAHRNLQEPQPGPEFEDKDEEALPEAEQLPGVSTEAVDGICPAAKYLADIERQQQEKTLELSMGEETPKQEQEPETPESNSDWKDAKEDVLKRKKSGAEIECLPGPDMGDDEEVIELDEEGRVTQKKTDRRASGGSGESAADDTRAESTEERAESPETAGSAGGMSLLIRNAQIVNDDSVFNADVLIQDSTITQVASSIEPPKDATILEASGRMLLPAGIDVHTNFSAPEVADDFKNGSRAAVAGGTATVVDVVEPKDGESLSAALSRAKKASEGSSCHVAFSIKVRQWSEATRKDMEKVVAEGVNSFILDIEGDDKLYQALEACKSLGAHARILPENRTIVSQLEKKMLELGITGPEGFLQSRPEELEKERVATVCLLSQITNCPISILSLSSAETATSLAQGNASGSLAHAEIAAAAVGSDGTHYFNKCLQHASAHMTDSPLRPEGGHAARLLQTLASAPLCVCASGHRAYASSTRNGKDFSNMPRGVAAVEERMAVLWEKGVRSGKIDPMRFVAVTSSNAAKIFNMYPKKGRIAVGADADVVLWDPIVKRKLNIAEGQSNADTSVFEGMTVHGGASITIVGGKMAWKEGTPGDAKGVFLPLAPNSPYLFSVVQMRDKTSPFEKVERSGAAPVATNGANKPRYDNPFDNMPVRPRKHHESSISFGGDERPTAVRTRNPPGGKTTGFW